MFCSLISRDLRIVTRLISLEIIISYLPLSEQKQAQNNITFHEIVEQYLELSRTTHEKPSDFNKATKTKLVLLENAIVYF